MSSLQQFGGPLCSEITLEPKGIRRCLMQELKEETLGFQSPYQRASDSQRKKSYGSIKSAAKSTFCQQGEVRFSPVCSSSAIFFLSKKSSCDGFFTAAIFSSFFFKYAKSRKSVPRAGDDFHDKLDTVYTSRGSVVSHSGVLGRVG